MKNNEIKQQFTKIAEDLYSTFDSVSKTGDFKSTKELCDYLVGLRGGKPLSNEFYSLLDNTSIGESFGVTSSALQINKKASDKVEMWKLAEVNGQMVFVANDTGLEVKGDDEEENELNKTASLHRQAKDFSDVFKGLGDFFGEQLDTINDKSKKRQAFNEEFNNISRVLMRLDDYEKMKVNPEDVKDVDLKGLNTDLDEAVKNAVKVFNMYKTENQSLDDFISENDITIEDDTDKKALALIKQQAGKTASSIRHNYKVAIKTGSISKTAKVIDLLKVQGYTDNDLFINPANPDMLVVDMESDLPPSKLTNQVADDLNKGYAGVPSCNIECCHDFCNCGHEPFDYPDLGADEFILIIPNGKNMIGNNVQTLVEYANANEIPSFKVHAANGDVMYNSEDVKEAPITREGEDAFQKQDGTIVSQKELEADPNALTEGEDVKVVNVETTGKFINDLLEKKSTNLTFADKTLLRYAMAKGWVEKVAYVSDESFAIKAGDATITVESDKANVIPPGAFTDGIQCDATPTNTDTDENIDVL